MVEVQFHTFLIKTNFNYMNKIISVLKHLSFTDNKSVIHIWLVHVSLKHTKSEKPASKNLGTCSAKICHLGHVGALKTAKNLFSLKFQTISNNFKQFLLFGDIPVGNFSLLTNYSVVICRFYIRNKLNTTLILLATMYFFPSENRNLFKKILE